MALHPSGQFLERALVQRSSKRDAVKPFDFDLSDILGTSARVADMKTRSAEAAQHLARAQKLKSTGEGDASSVSAMLVFVALASKLCVCDGPLNREEYLAFRAAFPLEGGVCRVVRRLFSESSTDRHDALHYARLLARLVPQSQVIRAQALLWLVTIARADGPVNATESNLLWQVAGEMNLPPALCRSVLKREARASGDAHAVLGVAKDAAPSTVRGAYLKAVRKLHPDIVQSTGVLSEAMTLAQRKTALLNDAYAALARPVRA